MDVPVVTGGKSAFDALLYPGNYVQSFHAAQETIQNLMSRVSDVARQSLQQSTQLFDRFFNDHAYQTAVDTRRDMAKDLALDETYHMTHLQDLQSATPFMRRWIMAEPTVNELYHKNRLDAYDDSYIAIDPDGVGKDNYDYRRVMDGVVQWPDEEDEGMGRWCIEWYSEETLEDEDLNIHQKSDILHTWKLARLAIEAEEDPTLVNTDI